MQYLNIFVVCAFLKLRSTYIMMMQYVPQVKNDTLLVLLLYTEAIRMNCVPFFQCVEWDLHWRNASQKSANNAHGCRFLTVGIVLACASNLLILEVINCILGHTWAYVRSSTLLCNGLASG